MMISPLGACVRCPGQLPLGWRSMARQLASWASLVKALAAIVATVVFPDLQQIAMETAFPWYPNKRKTNT